MNEKELIATLQSHLSSNLSPEIRTNGMGDERPRPVIVIEDWDTEDMNFHNSPFSGDATYWDDNQLKYERYLTFDWKTRVEFAVRGMDEVNVTGLKDNLTNLIRLIRDRPQNFHEAIKRCSLGRGGNPTNNFTEPEEFELMLAARFYGDHTITITPDDGEVIKQVTDSFTFNP